MMSAAPEPVFRQRFCQAPDCRVLFFICSHCDRGQRYCSSECRERSRLEQQRAARRRHQQSPEGRLDHRDRQRSYRMRQAAISRASAAKSVTDHTSHLDQTSATIRQPRSWWPLEPVRELWRSLGAFVCRFCGRVGRFLNPFAEPG
jgi:hypothetical protein